MEVLVVPDLNQSIPTASTGDDEQSLAGASTDGNPKSTDSVTIADMPLESLLYDVLFGEGRIDR
jgi:hypothetical protein